MSQQHMKIIDLRQSPHHLTTLADWHHKQWSEYNEDESLQQRIERMHSYLDNQIIPSTYIAVDDDTLLGSAAIVECDMDTRPDLTPWLASVYVREDLRSKGIGRQLVEHVMHTSYNNGIEQLYLFTPDSAGFYQKLGWQVICEDSYLNHAVTVMKISLTELIKD